MCRYITREMVDAKAIEKRDIPIFLSGWLDKSSENCMFDDFLFKTWKFAHLKTGGWFLECQRSACPADEVAILAEADSLTGTALPSEGLGESEEEVEILAATPGGSLAGVAAASNPHQSGSTSRSNRRGLRRSQETPTEVGAELELQPVHVLRKGKEKDRSSPYTSIPVSQSTASNFSSEF